MYVLNASVEMTEMQRGRASPATSQGHSLMQSGN